MPSVIAEPAASLGVLSSVSTTAQIFRLEIRRRRTRPRRATSQAQLGRHLILVCRRQDERRTGPLIVAEVQDLHHRKEISQHNGAQGKQRTAVRRYGEMAYILVGDEGSRGAKTRPPDGVSRVAATGGGDAPPLPRAAYSQVSLPITFFRAS